MNLSTERLFAVQTPHGLQDCEDCDTSQASTAVLTDRVCWDKVQILLTTDGEPRWQAFLLGTTVTVIEAY